MATPFLPVPGMGRARHGQFRRQRPFRGGEIPSRRWKRGTSLELSTSCPKFVPGSPRPPLRHEGRVDPGPMGHYALGTSFTSGETRRGLRVSPTTQPGGVLRFAIIGVGGVGGYFGARLAEAGHEVVFIARG